MASASFSKVGRASESFRYSSATFIYTPSMPVFASIPTNSPQQQSYHLSQISTRKAEQFKSSTTSIAEERLEMKRARDEDPVGALDMANCLMLLSTVGESDKTSKSQSDRGFVCKTCNREFSSFQALGGHRASHKKPRLTAGDLSNQPSSPAKPKTHECSVCGLEFAIGQALGGHMRRHRTSPSTGSVEQALPVMKKSVGGKRVFGLDLNLTPMENDLRLQLVSPMVDCFF